MWDVQRHPCFSSSACDSYARVHLPVAKRCNMQCNYCLRRYSCVNESRPGVTARVMQPGEAVEHLSHVMLRIPQVSVAGIAGPGEPLANPETFETFRLLQERYPELMLCVSTNGLLLQEHAGELKRAGVSFVTVTINALSQETWSRIYSWVEHNGRRLSGHEAWELHTRRQWEGLEAACRMGFVVKVNTVFIPEVNAAEIPEIARRAALAGASLHNIIPLIPVRGSRFAGMREPTREEVEALRELCSAYLPQMRHCVRCRADAAGFLKGSREACG
ncbi:MAG: radical SAM protein [Euryarchaeota archaeon]|nr:radical SAM protein [Euryarchaeota archaeon]